MGKVIRKDPEEELVRILKYATKGYRADKPHDYQGCINCERHWLAIKQIVNQLGGFHQFKENLIQGKRINEEMKHKED
jgi:hypothetical protein